MEKKSQMVNMRYPTELLKQIDEYQEQEGFLTRTQAIQYLLRKALEDEIKSKDK